MQYVIKDPMTNEHLVRFDSEASEKSKWEHRDTDLHHEFDEMFVAQTGIQARQIIEVLLAADSVLEELEAQPVLPALVEFGECERLGR